MLCAGVEPNAAASRKLIQDLSTVSVCGTARIRMAGPRPARACRSRLDGVPVRCSIDTTAEPPARGPTAQPADSAVPRRPRPGPARRTLALASIRPPWPHNLGAESAERCGQSVHRPRLVRRLTGMYRPLLTDKVRGRVQDGD